MLKGDARFGLSRALLAGCVWCVGYRFVRVYERWVPRSGDVLPQPVWSGGFTSHSSTFDAYETECPRAEVWIKIRCGTVQSADRASPLSDVEKVWRKYMENGRLRRTGRRIFASREPCFRDRSGRAFAPRSEGQALAEARAASLSFFAFFLYIDFRCSLMSLPTLVFESPWMNVISSIRN